VLHKVPVVLAIDISGTELQRRLVRLHRISPLFNRVLRGRLLNLLARAVQGIAEVVVRILLIRQAPRIACRSGIDGILEGLCRLRELPGAIG